MKKNLKSGRMQTKKILLSGLLAVVLLGTCITAFALVEGTSKNETVVFDVSSYTTASILNASSGSSYFHTFQENGAAPREAYKAELTVEEYASQTFAKFLFKNGSRNLQYFHLKWAPSINIVGKQYLAIRMINDSVAKVIQIAPMSGWLATNARLLYTDGSVEAALQVGSVTYSQVIPANFDGWYLVDLTVGMLNGRSHSANGPAGQTFARSVDTTALDVYTGANLTPFNFTVFPQTVFYMGEYYNGTARAFTADTNLYMGDMKLMDLQFDSAGAKEPPANLNAVIVNGFNKFTESSVNSSNFYSSNSEGIDVSVVNESGDVSLKIANTTSNTAVPFTLGLLHCGSFSVLNGGVNPWGFTMYVKTGSTPVTIVQIFNNQAALNTKAWIYNMNGEEIANSGEAKSIVIPADFEGYYVATMDPAKMDWTKVGYNFAWWQKGGELTVDNFGFVTSEITAVTTAPPTTPPTEPPTTAPPTTPPTEPPTTAPPTTPPTEPPTTAPPTTAPPTTTPIGPKSLISDGDMATSGALGTTEWKTLTNGDTDISFRFITYLGGGDNGGALLFKRNSYSDYATYSCVYQDIPVSEFDSGSYVLRAYLRGYQIEAYQKASETAKGSRLFVQYLDANNNVLNQIDGERLPYGADETAWKLYSVTFDPKSSAGAVSVRVGFISYQLICETAIDGVSLVKASDSAPAYSTAAPVQSAQISDPAGRNPFSAETLAPTPTVTRGTVPPSPTTTTPAPTTPSNPPSSGTATIPPSGVATTAPGNSDAPAPITGDRSILLSVVMCLAALAAAIGTLWRRKIKERNCQ